eukprot:scaffold246_cov414-Prasinococcus_capsulatus_cf.AAC.20
MRGRAMASLAWALPLIIVSAARVAGLATECLHSQKVEACLLEVEDSSVFSFNAFSLPYSFARLALDQILDSPEPFSSDCCTKFVGPVARYLQYSGLMGKAAPHKHLHRPCAPPLGVGTAAESCPCRGWVALEY